MFLLLAVAIRLFSWYGAYANVFSWYGASYDMPKCSHGMEHLMICQSSWYGASYDMHGMEHPMICQKCSHGMEHPMICQSVLMVWSIL
ncbi:hypothetical protein CEXT_290531 [Caerostris extrusa]|uniref:Secreted protein n=1 Tax=Caerostris extrusa TaxID=172846 RepID=A0AAV4UTK7_CAEEX|nr:hypothetical protein CEXT_290531 [Caerostris extrusa]